VIVGCGDARTIGDLDAKGGEVGGCGQAVNLGIVLDDGIAGVFAQRGMVTLARKASSATCGGRRRGYAGWPARSRRMGADVRLRDRVYIRRSRPTAVKS